MVTYFMERVTLMHLSTILRFLVCLIALTTTILSGCEKTSPTTTTENSGKQLEAPSRLLHPGKIKQPDKPTVATPALSAPVNFMNQPMTLQRFESASEALAVWRQFSAQKPALLILAGSPHLMRGPDSLREQIDALVINSGAEAIKAAGNERSSNPLFLPGMAVDIALRNDLFSSLYWALPLRDPNQELDLDRFREQLTSAGIANAQEAATLVLDQRIFNGQLRGQSFTAAALPLLQNLPQPIVVHIDLSYFQPLYKNEIATPLLGIIHDTLATLRKMHLKTLAVTFSYSHGESKMALDVRFLGELLKELAGQPELLDAGVPPLWARQADALYLNNFFQKEKIRELYEAQEQEAPQAAWVKFNLFRSAAEHKEGNQALDYLAQAAALDPAYALEYLELSQLAYEKERPDEALRMLSLASQAFPNDPFIKLQMAQLAQELGEDKTAAHLADQLRALAWSPVYYPQMDEYLKSFLSFPRGATKTAPVKTPDARAPAQSQPALGETR